MVVERYLIAGVVDIAAMTAEEMVTPKEDRE
jgi:hypothetical protein